MANRRTPPGPPLQPPQRVPKNWGVAPILRTGFPREHRALSRTQSPVVQVFRRGQIREQPTPPGHPLQGRTKIQDRPHHRSVGSCPPRRPLQQAAAVVRRLTTAETRWSLRRSTRDLGRRIPPRNRCQRWSGPGLLQWLRLRRQVIRRAANRRQPRPPAARRVPRDR